MAFVSVNPASGETVAEFSCHDDQKIEEALALAGKAFAEYRRITFAQRSEWLRAAADLLEKQQDELGRIITLEMGKLIGAAREEVAKCAGGCRFYAENGEKFLHDQPGSLPERKSFIRYQPLGPILAIMPWNFPFWQVFRFAAPALMAGNVGLLKHAANVPQCALAIESIFREAGFPEGVFQTLLIESDEVKDVIEDPRIKAVTLTGSERAGAAVASAAAAQIKKAVLELGGSDPFVVMPSARLEDAVAVGVKSRTINTGQSCIAAKRFIVADAVYEEFERAFVERMRALRIGDPMDPETELGPLSSEKILHDLHQQVEKSVRAGARLLTGGKRVDRPGFYYEPTVLADVPPDCPAAREELFGPVAALFRVKDKEEALALANATSFGLGANAWTEEAEEQELFADELEAGLVFINGMVASDPRLPFGGIKRSGYGRELSAEGIREFVNVKTVVVSRGQG